MLLPKTQLSKRFFKSLGIFRAGVVFAMPVFLFLSDQFLRVLKVPDIPASASQRPYTLSPEEYQLLKDGDIVMRRGHGFVSAVINELFQTGYNLSHCAIVAEENGLKTVIHSVSSELSGKDGVQQEPLEQFVNESVRGTFIAVRLKREGLDAALPLYYVRKYLQQHIPFDDKFDLNDSTRLYCTELIYRAYLQAYGEDLFTGRFQTDHPDFLSLSAFLDTSLFKIIINHQSELNKAPEATP